jgi:hypothetical protein
MGTDSVVARPEVHEKTYIAFPRWRLVTLPSPGFRPEPSVASWVIRACTSGTLRTMGMKRSLDFIPARFMSGRNMPTVQGPNFRPR